MMSNKYWQKQTTQDPLFPDFEWKIPERKLDRGNLLIIGGNTHSFAGVATVFSATDEVGVGGIRVILPDILQKTVAKMLPEAIFWPSNPSGGFASGSLGEAKKAVEWADVTIFAGDTGQNSETALLFEKILIETDGKIVVARDSVDLLKNLGDDLLNRPNTTICVSLAQLQKLFQSVYYPKILTFSMNLTAVIETLHKFTSSYPIAIELWHLDNIILAQNGEIITQKNPNAMKMWNGKIPGKSAVYEIWSDNLLEALAASVI